MPCTGSAFTADGHQIEDRGYNIENQRKSGLLCISYSSSYSMHYSTFEHVHGIARAQSNKKFFEDELVHTADQLQF